MSYLNQKTKMENINKNSKARYRHEYMCASDKIYHVFKKINQPHFDYEKNKNYLCISSLKEYILNINGASPVYMVYKKKKKKNLDIFSL